eukprot:2295114-Prorocentrum_lima.AAC.1
MFGENAVLLGATLLDHGNSNVVCMEGVCKHGSTGSIRGEMHSKCGNIVGQTEEVSEGGVASDMHK